jgi:hypothetical protein
MPLKPEAVLAADQEPTDPRQPRGESGYGHNLAVQSELAHGLCGGDSVRIRWTAVSHIQW